MPMTKSMVRNSASKYLAPDADIARWSDFENAIMKRIHKERLCRQRRTQTNKWTTGTVSQIQRTMMPRRTISSL